MIMENTYRFTPRARFLLAAIVAGASCAASQPETRGIVPEEIVNARAHKTAHAAKPKYQPLAGSVTGPMRPASSPARQIGVTIWKLRAATPADTGARILVQEESNTIDWIPERVSSASSLREGDRVRLTMESPEPGYLYVIDRERYSSGERGSPFLIFPTTRTRGGDNKVMAGKLIDIPAQDDQPNFFRLRRSRPDQTEEELTVLLTPEPLEGIEIGPRPLALSEEQASEWEKRWGSGKFEIFELTGGAGKSWTRAEQEAASRGTRLLTQDDPPPQTVYRVAAKTGDPLLVKIRLRYHRN